MNRPSRPSGTGWSRPALKLVLEPIFEADFLPCSYGFRPDAGRMTRWPRCTTSRPGTYEWVVEGGHQGLLGSMVILLLC